MKLNKAVKSLFATVLLFCCLEPHNSFAKEQKIYVCDGWKKILFEYNRIIEKVETGMGSFALTIQDNEIKFRPGFVPSPRGTLPKPIFAQLIASQDHRRDFPVRKIYKEAVEYYPRFFQVMDVILSQGQITIRQLEYLGGDIYSTCTPLD